MTSVVQFGDLLQPMLPAVEKELGGPGPAKDFLYAQAYRRMVRDGP